MKKIDGITLIDKNKIEITSIKKDEIKTASINIENRRSNTDKETETLIEKIETRSIQKKNIHVSIAKPDLAGKTPWKVIYEGNSITVKINDSKFLEEVNQGKYSFANGTILLVDLEIHQEFDSNLKIFMNKSYSVIKFHNLVEPPSQISIF